MKLFRFLQNVSKPGLTSDPKHVTKVVHLPVLAQEITETLSPQDGQYFLDMTFGGGGHTKYLLMTNKKITVFALDRDPEAFERAIVLAKNVSVQNNGQKVIPLLGRFSELPNLLNNFNMPHNFFDGAIMDLGASSYQFDEYQRGFSIKMDGPLDMRMDGKRFPDMPTAADIVNTLDAEDLAKIFKIYGEEKKAMKIAQAILDSRFMMKRLNTTRELATLISNLLTNSNRFDKLGRSAHPATKVFQALRIFVNNELNELNYGLKLLSKYLKIDKTSYDCESPMVARERNGGGLLAAISFHSLEDKIIKTHFTGINETSMLSNIADYNLMAENTEIIFKNQIQNKKWKFFKEKLLYPSESEVHQNPRSRSAKLRFGLRTN